MDSGSLLSLSRCKIGNQHSPDKSGMNEQVEWVCLFFAFLFVAVMLSSVSLPSLKVGSFSIES